MQILPIEENKDKRLRRLIKKWLPFVVVFLIAAAGMERLTRYIIESDSNFPVLQNFVSQDENIRKIVGEITNIRILKTVKVFASSNASAYSLYTVSIEGANHSSIAIIRIESTENRNKIKVESLRMV